MLSDDDQLLVIVDCSTLKAEVISEEKDKDRFNAELEYVEGDGIAN